MKKISKIIVEQSRRRNNVFVTPQNMDANPKKVRQRKQHAIPPVILPPSPRPSAFAPDLIEPIVKEAFANSPRHLPPSSISQSIRSAIFLAVSVSFIGVFLIVFLLSVWSMHRAHVERALYCERDAVGHMVLDETSTDLLDVKRHLRPLLTVIIPFYNAELAYLSSTFRSLGEQRLRDFEVVVVDDGTNDSSARRALENLLEQDDGRGFFFPVRVVCHTGNLGVASARNTGARNSRGQFIVFMDPDDELLPTTLEKLVLMAVHLRTFAGNSNPYRHGYIYPGVVHFGDENRVVIADFSVKRLLEENFITSFALLHRDVFLMNGGNCEAIRSHAESYDFYLRLSGKNIAGKLLREPLFRFRRRNATKVQQAGSINEPQRLLELRKNNPVAFGDLSTGMQHLSIYPQCHNRTFIADDDVREAHYRWKRWTAYQLIWAKESGSDILMRLLRLHTTLTSTRPLLVPFAVTVDSPTLGLLYFMPDISDEDFQRYDLSVIRSLRQSGKFNITVIVEQPMTIYHTIQDELESFVDDIFYLYTLSNGTDSRDALVDYLMITRQAAVVINRHTEAGYRAFERWTAHHNNLRLVDVLHAASQPGEQDVWDARSTPLHTKIHLRILSNQHVAQTLQQRLGLKAMNNTQYLPLSVDTEMFSPSSDIHHHTEDGLVSITFMGSLHQQTELVTWVLVACRLQQLGVAASFQIIGEGPELGQLEAAKWIQERSASITAEAPAEELIAERFALLSPDFQTILNNKCDLNKLEILGYKTAQEKAEALRATRVLLLTSHKDTFPLVIARAVCVGVPVVAPALGSIPFMLKGRQGKLVDVNNLSQEQMVYAYADAVIAELKLSPPTAAEKAASYKSCLEQFDDKGFSSNINQSVQDLLKSVNWQQREREILDATNKFVQVQMEQPPIS